MPHPIFDFEWNADKADANFRKHGIRFEEAETAFADEFALVIIDEEHSDDEFRQIGRL